MMQEEIIAVLDMLILDINRHLDIPVRHMEWDRSRIRHRSNSLTRWIPTKMARSARTNS